MMRRLSAAVALAWLLTACLLFPVSVWAHPVAQGSMDISIQGESVQLLARVSLEEALVANTFSAESTSAMTTEAMIQAHGQYLARHVRLYVDDRIVTPSRMRSLDQSDAGDAFLHYEFHYDLNGSGQSAEDRRSQGSAFPMSIEQDVLNEFDFAPGNPWEATYIVNIVREGQSVVVNQLLTSKAPIRFFPHASETEEALTGHPSTTAFTDYLRLGMMHILEGYDHLLFIAALVLATVTLWDLIRIVTVFTLAHTLTLTLSVLDIVRLPSQVVEPMIAASIVVVALANLMAPHQTGARTRLLVIFCFGLFHGLGFAGGLLDAMTAPANAGVAVAITGFSLGVELGHQMVVLPLFFLLRLIRGETSGPMARSPAQAQVLKYGSGVVLIAGVVYLWFALSASSGLLSAINA